MKDVAVTKGLVILFCETFFYERGSFSFMTSFLRTC